ncbi:phosphocholine cytidylyltransferase family protein [Oceanispirochaeta sp.]|jgi:2-aminoethylphosphonate-pyruvate transaminase|uniref:phosphocholine cytidylyltransferase family protein n=1 Tax=Oceanispirochaeta sp. TaxID=2035350 RepID=UPI00263A323E|nr:phosphocholine cytidylyltransferase family protein [Oceanispirochaeta sp.]MDA3956735.1 phosphocholine cytidylyltransferase family protein [Oceanispirochaeta sp.]
MTETAVILAAGLGSRLKEYTREVPKSFMIIDGETLIRRSIKKLLSAGIKRIIIGTGHCADAFQEITSEYPEVSLIHSPRYKSTSSLYTLFNMRDRLDDSFLLLESDLLYEKRALTELLEHGAPDLVLGSDVTEYGDEVYLETDRDNTLCGVSKQREDLSDGQVNSILVGISKISAKGYQLICRRYATIQKDRPKMDYEHMLAELHSSHPFRVLHSEKLEWCEIDNEEDLIRARKEVYPAIYKAEGDLE